MDNMRKIMCFMNIKAFQPLLVDTLNTYEPENEHNTSPLMAGIRWILASQQGEVSSLWGHLWKGQQTRMLTISYFSPDVFDELFCFAHSYKQKAEQNVVCMWDHFKQNAPIQRALFNDWMKIFIWIAVTHAEWEFTDVCCEKVLKYSVVKSWYITEDFYGDVQRIMCIPVIRFMLCPSKSQCSYSKWHTHTHTHTHRMYTHLSRLLMLP